MPDAKEAASFPALGEGCVTLEHELVEGSWRAWSKSGVGDFAIVSQSSFRCADRTLERAAMFVVQLSEAIGQTKRSRSEQNANAIRQPFCEKENPGFAVVPDVGADV